jgi:hypothetical protein
LSNISCDYLLFPKNGFPLRQKAEDRRSPKSSFVFNRGSVWLLVVPETRVQILEDAGTIRVGKKWVPDRPTVSIRRCEWQFENFDHLKLPE